MPEESPLSFPKAADRDRLQDYDLYDKLYFGEHFDAFRIAGAEDFNQQYSRLRYIVANFPGLISRVMADMLFGETFTVDFKDRDNQDYMDGMIERNSLKSQLYESALANSRRGGTVFKMRVGQRNPAVLKSPSEVIFEEIPVGNYFPVLDVNATRYTPTQEVLINIFVRNGKTYMHKEIQVPGSIQNEVYEYDPKAQKIGATQDPVQFGFKPFESTGLDRTLIFYIPNVRDGSGYFGSSDYKDLMSLFFAINNRITKMDNILDKHSDPVLAVPTGIIDEDGKVKKSALGVFEVDSENPGFNKPEYIVWDANLEAAFKEIDKLVDFLFMFSEIAPATMGMDKDGKAESGRALKFRLLATIRKRNRKIGFYDQAICDMLEMALVLSKKFNLSIKDAKPKSVERPTIKWGDGIIADVVEMTDVAIKRVEAGLSTRADEIARLDGVTPDEAKDKVAEIDADMGPTVPVIETNINGANPPKIIPPNQPAPAPTNTPAPAAK